MTQVRVPPLIKEEPRVDRSRYWRLTDLARFPEENRFRYEIIFRWNSLTIGKTDSLSYKYQIKHA
jgi:hypothetical protein